MRRASRKRTARRRAPAKRREGVEYTFLTKTDQFCCAVLSATGEFPALIAEAGYRIRKSPIGYECGEPGTIRSQAVDLDTGATISNPQHFCPRCFTRAQANEDPPIKAADVREQGIIIRPLKPIEELH